MDWWTLLAFLFFFCACPLRSVDFRGFILEKTQGLSAVDALCQGHFPPKSRNLVIVIVFSKTAKRFNHNPWFSKFVLQDKVVSLWTWWRQQLLTLIFREISFRPERSCGQQKLPALRLNISAMWQRRPEHYRKKANLRMVQNRNSRHSAKQPYRFSVDRIWTCSAPAHFETLHFQRFSFNLENADTGGIMHKISLGNYWVTKNSDVPNFPKEVKIEIFQGSLNYPFSGVQTKHMYGNFEGFPF